MTTWTALLLGLGGSIHCLGMCGPLALCLPSPAEKSGALLLGRVLYNLGRVATYTGLGAAFGLAGKSFALAGFQEALSIAIGAAILTGLLFRPSLVQQLPAPRFLARLVDRLKTRMSRLLARHSLGSMTVLGLLNGLLPCGLVYIALAGAAAEGTPVRGATYMALFGTGTFPAMLAASLSGKWVQGSLRRRLQKAIPWGLALVAVLFILRGMALGIPYISPNLHPADPSAPACCH